MRGMPGARPLCLALLSLTMIAGCGESIPPRAPLPEGTIMNSPSCRLLVVDEPAPPGWQAGTPRDMKASPELGYGEYVRLDGKGVGTVVLLDYDVDIGRVEHVDRTADLWILWPTKESGFEREATYAFPVLGPRGEALTQLVRIRGFHPRAVIDAPIARAEAVMFSSPEENRFVLLRRTGEDLFTRLDDRGKPISLPAGAEGVRPVHGFGVYSMAWAVKFPDGWSLAYDRDALAVQPARYNDIAYDKEEGGVFLGKRADGSCEATERRKRTSLVAPTCEAAAKNVVAKRAADEKAAAAAATQLAAQKREAAAMAAAYEKANAESLRSLRDSYLASARGRDWTGACRTGSLMLLKDHTALVSERAIAGTADPQERSCLARRGPDGTRAVDEAVRTAQQRRAAERQQQEQYAATHGYSSSSSSSGATPAGLPRPTHEEQMKKMNDYTYGSGRASSCPYSDPALCKK